MHLVISGGAPISALRIVGNRKPIIHTKHMIVG